jgi:hypothetical protein
MFLNVYWYVVICCAYLDDWVLYQKDLVFIIPGCEVSACLSNVCFTATWACQFVNS